MCEILLKVSDCERMSCGCALGVSAAVKGMAGPWTLWDPDGCYMLDSAGLSDCRVQGAMRTQDRVRYHVLEA